jgi:hypothetical protein
MSEVPPGRPRLSSRVGPTGRVLRPRRNRALSGSGQPAGTTQKDAADGQVKRIDLGCGLIRRFYPEKDLAGSEFRELLWRIKR